MTRLLVVEDSPTQAQRLRLILESEGFEVATAADGAEALERLTDSRFDLVISDIVMPGMSGYELCQAVKADPDKKDIPVLLLTTLSDPMDIIQGLECGADNFLTKPYDPANVVARVRGMIDNKLMRLGGKLSVGVEIYFLGRKFTISSDKEQILDLLLSTFEDVVRTNGELEVSQSELSAAKVELERYTRSLEDRVRQSETKYRSIMEQANDAIFVIGVDARILEVNRQSELLLGRSTEELVGRPYIELVVPAEKAYSEIQFRKLLLEGSANLTNLQLLRGDSSVICADFSASLVQAEGQRIVLAIAHDVTERNRLQQQVFQNEKLATVGTLATGIAHEINNPTAVILANMGVIKDHTDKLRGKLAELWSLAQTLPEPMKGAMDRLAGNPDHEYSIAEMDEVIRDCASAGERIRDIVRDLKGFAHIDDGDVQLVNINDCIDATLRMASHEIRQRAQIEKRAAHDLPSIVASPGKLSQVFLNLLVNAAQAIDDGAAEKNTVSIVTSFADGRVRIDISDTGGGIPEDAQLRIFDPFFTTKPVGVGTGLGLSICQDIVKKHRGEIRVVSEVGRGTTFSVYLPESTGLELPRRKVPAEPGETCRSKVMVVDDEAPLLRLMERMLGGWHDVTTALGGRAAIELLRTAGASYDVILCDLMMPDTDGVDLHRYLTEQLPGLEKRMVFLSGGAFTPRTQDFLARVDTPRLDKPCSIEDLQRVIAEVVGRREKTRVA